MSNIPDPVFKDRLSKISWMKIYTREYGVQYSEMAILCLSPKASYHIPHPSVDQVVIPEENNTAFYIDSASWKKLVGSLNNTYTADVSKLEKYERQFNRDGLDYFRLSQKLSQINLINLSNASLLVLYKEYQDKLFRYSVFAWTSFILNDFVSKRAADILDKYIRKHHLERERQDIVSSLFKPEKKAAILQLQEDVSVLRGILSGSEFDGIYEKYRWMSCLDIHNKPWTIREFKEHIKTLSTGKKTISRPFTSFEKRLKISKSDMEYLLIARKFVYIKDARDDYRRKGVYLSSSFFKEIAGRIGITVKEFSYLSEKEVVGFLSKNTRPSPAIVNNRQKGFLMYLSGSNDLICLSGNEIKGILKKWGFIQSDEKQVEIKGAVASKGNARGKVVIVKGVRNLAKVFAGNILVAISTHPDYVPAMKKAAAIITDEGGITSHAAIVSREFGIPCIVGTKNATKILRDGDIVEINGKSGLIKILI